MLVGRRMRTSLITLTKDATLAQARELLHAHRIRHLPIVEGNRLLGILTDRDIRQASPSSAAGISPDQTEAFLAQIPVSEAMVSNVRTVSPYTTVEEAARLMIEHKIGCLPVTEMITHRLPLGEVGRGRLHCASFGDQINKINSDINNLYYKYVIYLILILTTSTIMV